MTWKHFSYQRDKMLACPCCGTEGMNNAFMKRLDGLRDRLGYPLRVTSGFRCPAYNNKISASGVNGPHTTGEAVDLLAAGKKAWEIVGEAYSLGFTGIGVQQKGPHLGRFVHLDTCHEPHMPRPFLFTY